MTIEVKICGLSTFDSVKAAVAAGASYVGFVLFDRSPRFVKPSRAAELGGCARNGVCKVGLVVDADDAFLEEAVADGNFDMLQLHGKETPDRVAEIRSRFGLPVIKALAIADPADVAVTHEYEATADMLLFDAKPPLDAERPGGNAVSFDWSLLSGESWAVPWMLAGGLDHRNLEEAVNLSGAGRVDVSSGVEDRPGVKNNDMIRSFLEAAKRC
ncbi:MAG: phosphoribosylanthranilate isomerase [Rhodospirillales bacterium]|nr:phosphoribosylanthranilate isomerase [Rhodospirillales bacterium]